MGSNGSGKSAIARALEWVTLNQWDGEAGGQVTWGEDECSVELEFQGHHLARGRSGGKNLYTLDDEDYHAFRDKVPPPISHLLMISEENFQPQDEPPFWLHLTPGQAATALNEIFNLSAIDTSLSSVASDLRRARERVNICEERLSEAREQEQQTEWAVHAGVFLSELKEREDEVRRLDEDILELGNAVGVLVSGDRKLTELEARVERAEELVSLADQLQELDDEMTNLLDLIDREEKLCLLENRVKELEEEVRRLSKGRCPLCGRK